jgi:hypothetical protein
MSNLKRWTIPATHTSSETDREVRKVTAAGFRSYESAPALSPAKPQFVRAGKAGGLPFETLTTDLFAGCLPAREICYGNCFAARGAYSAGVDFAVRVRNILDRDLFVSDLQLLPANQKFLRNGWNSDPSWDWSEALRLARWIRESGRLTIFNTKSFTRLDPAIMKELAALKAEFWLCVSAFDTDAQLEHRIGTIESYREAGGVAVPLVMTTRFLWPELNDKQDRLVRYMVDHDLPAAENSLRFAPHSPVLDLLDMSRLRPIAQTGDFWCGRLYDGVLLVPTTSSLPCSYSGMQSSYLSGNDPEFLKSLYCDPVPTQEEVLASPPLQKPLQAGVPLVQLAGVERGNRGGTDRQRWSV